MNLTTGFFRIRCMATQHRVYLTPTDGSKLEATIRSGSALARYQTKARILLLTDLNNSSRMTDKKIIAALGTSNSNIQRTRMDFLERGLPDCLEDRPRSGRKPRITGDIQAKIAVIACSDPPEGRKSWTLQLIAEEAMRKGVVSQISRVTVFECLKKTNSNPGRL